jgi:GNAT superfamily N-acetyltransferase
VLVARRDATAVGYAFVHLRAGSPTWELGERAGELETLSVLADERDRGTGRLLLDAVCARLQTLGASEVGLHLLCGNAIAERFYEREGFKPFAVWLTRPLPPPG